MKKIQILFYFLLIGLIVWGFINPDGNRAAVANNKWSLSFVENYYEEDSTWQALPDPPTSHPHAKLLLARKAIDSGDDNLALKYITPLVGPDNPMVTNTYAEIEYRQGNHTEAINAWKMTGNIEVLHQITMELRDKGLLDVALYASQCRYSLDKETTTAMLASLYAQRNDNSIAIELLDQAMENFPDSSNFQRWVGMKSSIRLTEANSYARQGLIKEAELAYQQSVTVDPYNWVAWKNFGWFYYNSLNDINSAIMCFEREVNANPEIGEGQFDLARMYATQKEMESAIYWFEEAIEIKPDNKGFQLTYANFLRNSQELSKAIEIYDQMLLKFPDYSDAYFEASIAYSQNQEPEKAIQSIEKALQLVNPPQLKYYLLAGSLYESVGNNKDALKVYENALTLDPGNPEALQAKARLSD